MGVVVRRDHLGEDLSPYFVSATFAAAARRTLAWREVKDPFQRMELGSLPVRVPHKTQAAK